MCVSSEIHLGKLFASLYIFSWLMDSNCLSNLEVKSHRMLLEIIHNYGLLSFFCSTTPTGQVKVFPCIFIANSVSAIQFKDSSGGLRKWS